MIHRKCSVFLCIRAPLSNRFDNVNLTVQYKHVFTTSFVNIFVFVATLFDLYALCEESLFIGTTWQSQNHSRGLHRCARNDYTEVCLYLSRSL